MALENPHGHFDEEWWKGFWKVLYTGDATRRGGSKASMTERARQLLPDLGMEWAASVKPNLGGDVSTVDWEGVAPFPDLVAKIKGVSSPVFTSKFCHFLAPKIFPVTDNAAMGLPRRTYKAHFQMVQCEWAGTDEATRALLEDRMISRIKVPMYEDFPMVNKIVELCLIGRHSQKG